MRWTEDNKTNALDNQKRFTVHALWFRAIEDSRRPGRPRPARRSGGLHALAALEQAGQVAPGCRRLQLKADGAAMNPTLFLTFQTAFDSADVLNRVDLAQSLFGAEAANKLHHATTPRRTADLRLPRLSPRRRAARPTPATSAPNEGS